MFRVVYFPKNDNVYETSNTMYDYKAAFELGLIANQLFQEVYITENRWNSISNKMEYILYIVNSDVVYVTSFNRKNIVYSHKPEDARGMKIRDEFYKAIKLMNENLKMYKKYIPYTDEYIHSIGISTLVRMYLRLLDHPCIKRYRNELSHIVRILKEFDILEPDHNMTIKNIYDNFSISKLLDVGETLKEYYNCKDLDIDFR